MSFDPFAQLRLTDHVALVTGGAQNIGEARAYTTRAMPQATVNEG